MAAAEFFQRGLMGEGAFRPEESDRKGAFQFDGSGHDFAVDRQQRIAVERPVVERSEAFEERAFPFRHIDRLVVLDFPLADLLGESASFVEHPDDILINCVNAGSEFFNIHSHNSLWFFCK